MRTRKKAPSTTIMFSTNANFVGVHPFEKRLVVSDAREK